MCRKRERQKDRKRQTETLQREKGGSLHTHRERERERERSQALDCVKLFPDQHPRERFTCLSGATLNVKPSHYI